MGTNKVILLLLALSGALLAWMFFGINPEFQRLSGAGGFLDARLSGYEADAVRGLQAALADPARAEARDLLQLMYLGPDLVLPFVLTLAFCLLFRGYAPGVVLYGRRLDVGHAWLLCFVPVAYGVVDYLENFGFLSYFPPAEPGPWLAETLPQVLPWVTRIKFVLLFVSGLLALRVTVFSGRSEGR